MTVQTIRIQIIAVIGSLLLLALVIELLRKRKLKEEYTLLWLLGGVTFLTISVFRSLLDRFAVLIGVDYPPAALFLILLMGVFLMLLHFSLLFSKMSEKIKALAQEVALLKLELDGVRSTVSIPNMSSPAPTEPFEATIIPTSSTLPL